MLINVLLVSDYLDILKSSEDWKLQSIWERLNREIECPFSYLPIEIAKIKSHEILSCQNGAIKYQWGKQNKQYVGCLLVMNLV